MNIEDLKEGDIIRYDGKFNDEEIDIIFKVLTIERGLWWSDSTFKVEIIVIMSNQEKGGTLVDETVITWYMDDKFIEKNLIKIIE